MVDTPTKNKQIVWGPRIVQVLAAVLSIVSGRIMRLAILSLSVVVVGWLLYANVTQPFQRPVELPAGVTERNPAVASDLLQGINAAQEERSQVRTRSFSSYERFFAAPPSPVPTPVISN